VLDREADPLGPGDRIDGSDVAARASDPADGFLAIDADAKVLYANDAAEALLGRLPGQLLGSTLVLPEGDGHRRDALWDLGAGLRIEWTSSPVDWQGRPARLVCLRDAAQNLSAQQRIYELVNELLELNQKLVHQAREDPLTGLLNRRGLQEVFGEELGRMHRDNSSLSALFIDCDDFKSINDHLSYAMGDSALTVVAQTLTRVLRPQDRVGRVGGDEFLVLLPATRPAEATQVGQRILHALSIASMPRALRERGLTVSIGVDLVAEDVETIEQVLLGASAPLRVAKSTGKHRVADIQAEVGAASPSGIEAVLSDPACLRVVSQCIVRLTEEDVVGYELLVRGPPGELEAPRVLFALANSANRLAAFDLNCLRGALSARALLPAGTRCHINIHPATLIGAPISAAMEVIGPRSSRNPLCLEISERELVGSPMQLKGHRVALRDEGIEVALDDVGFGQSSLEALVVLEPDIVKIDRRFIHGISKDAGRARDLRRLVGVVQGLGARIIAEGIERAADVEHLVRMGIELGQGFLWGKPAPILD